MIKKLLLVALLSSLAFAKSYKEFAAEYKYETNYDKALQRAKVQKKDILLVLVTNYCPWCRKLEKKVLASERVNEVVQKNYIPLIVNREEGTLKKQFETPIVPVTYIISYKDDTKFTTTRGYKGKENYLHLIQKK